MLWWAGAGWYRTAGSSARNLGDGAEKNWVGAVGGCLPDFPAHRLVKRAPSLVVTGWPEVCE